LQLFKDYEQKKCFYCGKNFTKKNGVLDGRQRYKCALCGKQFLGGERLDFKNKILSLNPDVKTSGH